MEERMTRRYPARSPRKNPSTSRSAAARDEIGPIAPGMAVAMKRVGFVATQMGGGLVVWRREAEGVELLVMHPRHEELPRKLSEPAVLYVSAPALTGGSESLVSLRFPTVTAMLAAVRGGRVGPH
jgi:hypothetical protein